LLFNSVAFFIFLPVVVLLYYFLPQKYRWVVLLAASYFFYGSWKIEFLSLIMFSTLVDFYAAQALHRQKVTWRRNVFLGISLSANLGLLFAFKYLVLFLPSVDPMIANIYTVDHPFLGFLLQGVYFSIPVGISFYTFQTLSYTLDVYHNRIEPEKHLGHFALFVSFFPQLVAGPIERFSRLMPQLKAKHVVSYKRFQQAFRLMLYGFFIKMCIADNLSPLVDAVYDNPSTFTQWSTWFGTFAFGLQIYTDFAGYSLIAQGAALCLGISLMDNFKTPYFSTSIGEFWNRWHISLSTWFRDYVYVPLGGNRVSLLRWVVNILAVFIISGFWHGANYTFLIWGAIHGMLYLVERLINANKRLPQTRFVLLAGGVAIFICVNIAWLFFRIDSLQQVPRHVNALFQTEGVQNLTLSLPIITMLVTFLIAEILTYNSRFDRLLDRYPTVLRWIVYAGLIWCIAAWAGVTNHPFIYFQF
jgi:alginate O-acetyltransferase complex protein AlgI